MENLLKFKLELKEIPVVLEKDGQELKYKLVELTGKQRSKYLDSIASRFKMDGAGKISGVKSFEGMNAALLSRCLINSEGEFVPTEEIEEFPSSVQQQLFEAAQSLSGLDANEEKEGNG